MNLKKTGIVVLALVLVAIVLALFLDDIIEGKVEKMLQKEFGQKLQYESLDSNVLFGDFEIDSVSFKNEKIKVFLKEFHVRGFGYWSYFFEDKIAVDKVKLLSPKITVWKAQDSLSKKRDSLPKQKSSKKQLKKTISVDLFAVENGSLFYLGEEKKDTILSLPEFGLEWGPIVVADSLPKPNPLKTGSYSFWGKDLRYDLVKLHNFGAKEFRFSDEAFVVSGIWLKPAYSRKRYRELIPSERDMYDLEIDSIRVENPYLRVASKTPIFKSPKTKISGVHFEVFRDKTVPDDPRKKKMYSEVVHDLKMDLGIENLAIRDAYIQYTERIKSDRPLGMVEFYNLSADIQNLTNIGMDSKDFPKTKIDIHTDFMNTTDLWVDWQFDVSNKTGEFSMFGRTNKIPPEAMNPFFIAAMNIKSEGSINELYFNINGDKIDALTDMKLVYDDFEIKILEKNGKDSKEIVSLFANLFLKGDSRDGPNSVENVRAVRDPTKSFWNYFWKCILAGLKKAML